MKNKILKKTALALIVCTMFLENINVVNAATPTHECAFSYMGVESYGTITAGTHAYIKTYENGEPVYGSCTVLIDRYAYVYKCACGAKKRGTTFSSQIHSACGQ